MVASAVLLSLLWPVLISMPVHAASGTIDVTSPSSSSSWSRGSSNYIFWSGGSAGTATISFSYSSFGPWTFIGTTPVFSGQYLWYMSSATSTGYYYVQVKTSTDVGVSDMFYVKEPYTPPSYNSNVSFPVIAVVIPIVVVFFLISIITAYRRYQVKNAQQQYANMSAPPPVMIDPMAAHTAPYGAHASSPYYQNHGPVHVVVFDGSKGSGMEGVPSSSGDPPVYGAIGGGDAHAPLIVPVMVVTGASAPPMYTQQHQQQQQQQQQCMHGHGGMQPIVQHGAPPAAPPPPAGYGSVMSAAYAVPPAYGAVPPAYAPPAPGGPKPTG
jgi:hypothetical protein